MSSDEAKRQKENKLWYLVKDILKCSQAEIVTEIIVPNNWLTDKLAMNNLSLLHTRLTND